MQGESASTYVGALRILAASCEYKAFGEEMIKDQLAEKVQEALLSKPDMTLQKALDIATRIESTCSYLEQMSLTDSKSQKTCAIKSKYKRSNDLKDTPDQKNSNTTTGKVLVCYRCGSTNHLANAKSCPAIGKICAKCSKKGHFAVVCKSKRNAPFKKVHNAESLTEETFHPAKRMKSSSLWTWIVRMEFGVSILKD